MNSQKSTIKKEEYYLIPVEWFNKFIAKYGLLAQDFSVPEFARQTKQKPQRFQYHIDKERQHEQDK